MDTTAYGLRWVLAIRTRVLLLVQLALYPWSHFPIRVSGFIEIWVFVSHRTLRSSMNCHLLQVFKGLEMNMTSK